MAQDLPPTSEVVGRATELARIVAWSEADGPPTLVVDGAPGLGKTTVLAAALDEIGRGGARVVSSAPTEAESRLSYSGLADLLANELDAVRDALPPPQASALAIALRIEGAGGRSADETAIARGTLEAVRAIGARHGRLVLAIDDLHWLDPPSLAAVVYVARRLTGQDGVRILATHRTGSSDPTGIGRIGALERLRLGPLSVGGIHRVVRLHAGISLPRPRLLEIHEMTDGNPLHAIETARAMESGIAPSDDSLAGLLAARVAALPRRAADALVLVAASSDRSVERLDAAWATMPVRGRTVAFADAIGPAVADELVSLAGGQVRPVHPLVTHVAFGSADAAGRLLAHRALAESSIDPEERALHLGRSVDGTDAAVADELESVARGGRAKGIRALRGALFERAAQLTPESDRESAGRRWLAAAEAWFDAGDTHRVERLLEPMIEAWPGGSQRAEARWRLGIALDEAGRWPEATVLWRLALDDTDDPAIRSQIQCSLSITALYTESAATAIEWATAGAIDAERSGDRRAVARALAVQAFILTMAGRHGSPELIDRALEIEATIDVDLGEWSPSALAAECARHAGDVPTSMQRYAAVLDRAVAQGEANVEQWAAFGLASAAMLAGELGRASELADTVLDIAEQTDIMRIPARTLRAHVDAYLGRLDSARATIGEALAMADAADEPTHLFNAHVVLATIESFAGNGVAAAAAYREARALEQRIGLAHGAALRALMLEVEVAASISDLEQAGEALAAVDALVGAEMPRWVVPLRRRAAAAVMAARNELDAAAIELEAAAGDELALAPDVARAHLALAAVLRRQRRYRQSREVAERARMLFAQMGMAPLATRAEREIARTPGRRPIGEGTLSPSESRIAELVASGHTNRAVAAELFLSIKTIEVTLTRVYDKLGLRSRAELAAHFRESEIPPKV